MDTLEFIGEILTVDSQFIKGWRYLFSSRMRKATHERWKEKGNLWTTVDIFLSLLFMTVEVTLTLYLVGWVMAK